jgi:hypothetical protein
VIDWESSLQRILENSGKVVHEFTAEELNAAQVCGLEAKCSGNAMSRIIVTFTDGRRAEIWADGEGNLYADQIE